LSLGEPGPICFLPPTRFITCLDFDAHPFLLGLHHSTSTLVFKIQCTLPYAVYREPQILGDRNEGEAVADEADG
jgi:hypothetical protein